MTHRALTVAGSDSGGGAGIQADLKTFAAFGSYAFQPDFDPHADLTGDGFVNLSDFTLLASHYAQPCPCAGLR